MLQPQHQTQKIDSTFSHSLPSDDETLFRRLTQRTLFSVPTVTLLFASLFGLLGGTYLYFKAPDWYLLALVINTFCLYTLYTVLHEATHRSVSTHKDINDWFGRISSFCIQPLTPFTSYRERHIQHHRYLHTDKDPESFLHTGSQWLLLLKWMVADFVYFAYYVIQWKKLSKQAHVEILGHIFLCTTIICVSVAHNNTDIVFWWFIPSRIAMVISIFVFSHLPHAQYWHHDYQHHQPVRNLPTACINLKYEWLLTPLCFSQNYHLMHHLYPVVPFYRYRKIWHSRINHHLAIIEEHSKQNRSYGFTPLKAHGRVIPSASLKAHNQQTIYS